MRSLLLFLLETIGVQIIQSFVTRFALLRIGALRSPFPRVSPQALSRGAPFKSLIYHPRVGARKDERIERLERFERFERKGFTASLPTNPTCMTHCTPSNHDCSESGRRRRPRRKFLEVYPWPRFRRTAASLHRPTSKCLCRRA